MKKKIVITGATGTIGTVLGKGLKEFYSLTLLDILELKDKNAIQIDIAKEYDPLREIFRNHQAVVHLAWDRKENFRSRVIISENKIMAENIYQAAVEAEVNRVIMASSVHADDYNWKGTELISPTRTPIPDSPYGATKVYIESLGRYFANKHGLSVICIRFGGVNPKDIITEEPGYSKVWLSHRDCTNLIRKCIETPKIPDNFCVIYGISNNTGRVHDWKNPVYWEPKNDASQKT